MIDVPQLPLLTGDDKVDIRLLYDYLVRLIQFLLDQP